MLNGTPVWRVPRTVSCQPPITASTSFDDRRVQHAWANGQVVNERANHAMLHIEVRRPVFAADAEVVLREELRRLGADAAGVVQRFRIGVGADEVEAVAEALVHLEGEGVVVRVAYVVHQLNHAIVRVGRTLQDALRRTIRIVPSRRRAIRTAPNNWHCGSHTGDRFSSPGIRPRAANSGRAASGHRTARPRCR